MLNQETLKSLLTYDPETGIFRWLKRPIRSRTDIASNAAWVGRPAGTPKDGYVQIFVNRRGYRAHRLAFLYMTGTFPKVDVDHINGARSDNRWCNLREATSSQNLANGRHKGTDRGARLLPNGRWQARVWDGGSKQISLGVFATKEEAVAAYKEAATFIYSDHPTVRCSGGQTYSPLQRTAMRSAESTAR